MLPALALGIALYAGRLAVVRPASARLAFAVTLAAAPLISSFVFYPYLVLSLPLVVLLCFIERRPAIRVVGLVGLLLTDLASPPAPWDTVPLVGLLILLVGGVVRATDCFARKLGRKEETVFSQTVANTGNPDRRKNLAV